ncbi:cingulin-like protein 1 isoform X5 [Halichondria panicea]|uniref:cingulin-like protein 1 isoform X5 n=1 Tax=Halichondria panicea TaxID=6063 RepID=UPI00312BB390
MAESTELELSNLQHKSTGWDNQGFEDLQSEEVELAKRDATTADSTGLGRLLFRGVTGAVDAVASLGAFGQKNGPKGATKIKEPQSHRQTTAEKRTGPQLHGETDLLDVAFQHSAELLQKNAELTKHLSNYETKKKQEINDLTAHLKELKRAVTVLNRDCEKKDKKIAEMKTLVQKLSDKKRDGSSELARALHEKDTQIEALAQLLQTEKVKLRVTCTEVKEKQKESEEYKKQTQELSNELKKYNRVDITFDKDIISDSGATHDTIHTPQDKEVQELNEAIQSEPTESPGESVALEKVDQLQEALREKEMQLANPENQLKEYEAKVLEMEQVRDHSKSQSKALLVVKQELDATKMSPDDLVQYIGSMERQVADTKTHCRKLEAQLNGAREDYDIAQQALRDTREGLEAELESVRETHSKLSTTNSSLEAQLFQAQEKIDNLSVEKEAFVQERAVLKQEIFDLHDKLAIATAEAELYKEDFESERKDREKAHDLREEMRCICDEKVHAMAKERHAFEECIQNLTRELQGLSNEKEGLLEIRAFTRQHKPQQNDKQIHELQEQLYVAHQKAITAQEEVQAKTAQVKQYKKKDDQREEKLISLEAKNQGLFQEMERVRSELIKAKTESANLLNEEKKANQNEMQKVRLELERALKKMSKSEAHDELLKVQLDNNLLRVDKERLNGSLKEVQEQFARLKLEFKKEVANATPTTPPTEPPMPNQLAKLVARNQELVQEMERVRSELEKTKFELEEKDRKLSTERDSDTFRDEFKKIQEKVDRLEKKATSGGSDYQYSPFVPVPVPQTNPINFQQIDSQGQSVYHDNSPQGHYQDWYQNQPQPRNVPPSNHPSQWPNQQPYLQDHLYQQQPDEQYEHPFSQRRSFQWDKTPSSQEHMESQHYPNRRSPHNYTRSLSYPAHISSQEDSSLSSTSLSESPNPSYSPTQVAMLPPPQARPRPKPRKANRKLSQQKEENELEKGLSTEIKKIVGDLFYQQYESEKQQTNEQVPFDPNLVCRVCSKQHRLGEIQKYRKHVKECEREQGVRAEEAAAKLASDTKPFSIKHSTD